MTDDIVHIPGAITTLPPNHSHKALIATVITNPPDNNNAGSAVVLRTN